MILLIAIMLSVVSFFKPKIGVLSLVGMFFLTSLFEPEVGGFTLNRLVGIFCILGIIKDIASGKNIDLRIDNFDFLFLGYLTIVGISVLINGFYIDTTSKIMNPVMGFVLYKLIVINIKNTNDFNHLLLTIFMVPMFFLPIVINASLESAWYRGALYDNANQVAEYLFMSCLACTAYFYKPKVAISSFFSVAYILMGVLCIYLTGSRTIVVSLPFLLILYLMIYNKKNSLVKPFAAIVGALFLFSFISYIASLLNQEAVDRISGFVNTFLQSDFTLDNIKNEERYILWSAGFKMLFNSPLFGVGFGGFRDVRRSYGIYGGMAHNSYVDILAETGIFGFFFAISMIVLVYKRLDYIKKIPASIIERNYLNLFIIFFVTFFAVWVSLHHKSISRSMFLIMGLCNALYYIFKDYYVNKKLNKS